MKYGEEILQRLFGNLFKKKKITFRSYSISKIEGVMAEWCLLAILLLYPFFATISILLKTSSTPLSMTYRAGYLLFALIIIFLETFTLLQRKRKYSIYIFTLTLFWIVYLVRMHYDFHIVGYNKGYASNGFVYYFQYGFLGSFLPAVAISLVVKKIRYKHLFELVRRFCLPVAICLIYIVNHEFGLGAEIFSMRFSLGGEEAIINPIIMSQYGGMISIVSFYALCYRKKTILDFILWGIGFGLLALGASRGPLIAVIVTHILLVSYIVKKRFKSIKIWANLSFVFLFLTGIFFKYVLPNIKEISLFSRVQQSVDTGQGLNERTLQWSSAWNQFLDNPIIGDLVVERALNYYPHNLILEILMATGLIGGVLFFILVTKSVANYFFIENKYERFIIYIMILHFMYAMFSLSLISIPQFWCTFMLTCCLNISKKFPYTYEKV